MAIQLNHTIVPARDPQASAEFLAELLGRGAPVRFGPFYGVELDNGVTLDFMRIDGKIGWQHYAFIVSDAEFDQIFGRIRARAGSPTGPTLDTIARARSTTTTAGVASIGAIPTGTTSRSSRVRTGAAVASRPVLPLIVVGDASRK